MSITTSNESAKDRPSRSTGRRYYDIPEASKATGPSKAASAASKYERETRGRGEYDDYKGEMEGDANVFAISRREEDMPCHLSAMEELLRQQHAVREQDRPQKSLVFNEFECGVSNTEFQTPPWLRDQTSRAWRLLLDAIREFLDTATKEELSPANLRLHPLQTDLEDRAKYRSDEPRESVDSFLRRWRRNEC